MINYSILKIKLLSIIESIDDYTSEPIISVPCATLKNDLENDTMTIDVLEYCCNIIEDWYKDNLSHICSNQYVIRPENHKKNTQTIMKIFKLIGKNMKNIFPILQLVKLIHQSAVIKYLLFMDMIMA